MGFLNVLCSSLELRAISADAGWHFTHFGNGERIGFYDEGTLLKRK